MSGKLIILEGADASGKSTQFKKLCQRLDSEKIPYKSLVFPRYSEKSATLLKMYLEGEFGNKPEDVNAYAASTFFAVDRYASYMQDWKEYYQDGGLIICDRYTTSNAVHQTAKMPDENRREFVDWLFEFEYKLLGIPQPDRVILLDMPDEASAMLLKNRTPVSGLKEDIHEANSAYLTECKKTCRQIAAQYNWNVINCFVDGKILSIDAIHKKIFEIVLSEIK